MTERKLTRHEMREAALLILFQMKLNPETLDEILEDCKESFEMEYNSQSVKLAKGVAEHEDELNGIIESYSPSRKLDRISYINLAIMKIALYEMKYCPSVPDKRGNRIYKGICRQDRCTLYKRRSQFIL